MKLNEDTLAEQPVIDWLKELGYEAMFSSELAPGGVFMERNDWHEVVLEGRLRRALKRINPNVSDEKLNEVAQKVIKFDHPDIELGNKAFYELVIKGVVVEIKDENGEKRGKTVKMIDFDNLQNNEFLVVNQYTVIGKSMRIPDVVVFINGIPIALFELKSPTRENATIADAFAQIHDTYKAEIPKIFFYNQILIISDLWHAKHGTVSTPWDFFSVWKGIKSEDEDNKGKSELEILVKGMFNKDHLLDLIKNFTIFEADADKEASKFTKKMAMYNQFFGVNKAVVNTLRAVSGDKKIGVFWQTQGSGKSLSMVFYAKKVRELQEMKGPTLLFLTDRNDLDGQLYRTFLRTGYPFAKRAESIIGLVDKLQGTGSEILFTTIQKFGIETSLSQRDNIIVVADEAHRSQYAELAGNLRSVLPNASFMGITGTPISLDSRNTQLVFGEHISIYPIDRAVDDEITVPIYYEGRLIPLHVLNDIDDALDDISPDQNPDVKEKLKKLVRLEDAVGSSERLKKISEDIISHFNNRGVIGKAMIVVMNRDIAVEMYRLIKKIPDAPETAVVISSNQDYKGQIQNETDNKELEKRFKNPGDPLEIVIVCDMWLTGFDIPCLQTIYLDKPLKGHGLMQAIARVNRRFKDKEGGLIVDYIGVADNLKKALAIYTSDIQKQALIPIEEIVSKMMEHYQKVQEFFDEIEYSNWKPFSAGEQAILFARAADHIVSDPQTKSPAEGRKKDYLDHSGRLYKLFALAMPHKEANQIRDEVEFFEGVRRGIVKSTIVDPVYIDKNTQTAVKDLVSKSVKAEEIINIVGKSKTGSPEISILDEKFLEEVKKSKLKNLTVETLHKLIEDEIRSRKKLNMFRFESLQSRLEKIIADYESNLISSSKIIEQLIEIAKEIKSVENIGKDLGLSPEEMAFYDALSQGKKALKDKELRQLVKELVKAIREDLSIDWVNHEVIKAKIRTNVRLILLQHGISFENLDELTNKVYDQAYYLYRDYSQDYTSVK